MYSQLVELNRQVLLDEQVDTGDVWLSFAISTLSSYIKGELNVEFSLLKQMLTRTLEKLLKFTKHKKFVKHMVDRLGTLKDTHSNLLRLKKDIEKYSEDSYPSDMLEKEGIYANR